MVALVNEKYQQARSIISRAFHDTVVSVDVTCPLPDPPPDMALDSSKRMNSAEKTSDHITAAVCLGIRPCRGMGSGLCSCSSIELETTLTLPEMSSLKSYIKTFT